MDIKEMLQDIEQLMKKPKRIMTRKERLQLELIAAFCQEHEDFTLQCTHVGDKIAVMVMEDQWPMIDFVLGSDYSELVEQLHSTLEQGE